MRGQTLARSSLSVLCLSGFSYQYTFSMLGTYFNICDLMIVLIFCSHMSAVPVSGGALCIGYLFFIHVCSMLLLEHTYVMSQNCYCSWAALVVMLVRYGKKNFLDHCIRTADKRSDVLNRWPSLDPGRPGVQTGPGRPVVYLRC